MRINKEDIEWASMDLCNLTRRETDEILSGAVPSAQAIRIIGGGKVSDDSVRRRCAIHAHESAIRRLYSPCCLVQDRHQIQRCIEELNAFIKALPQEVQS